MTFRLGIFAAFFAGIATMGATQSFEEVMSAAESQVGDIGKYQQALQNPDQRMQYALVQQMLKVSDPALQRIAKEHALFSTNPVMREAAIKAILDSGATLRIQLAGDKASAAKIADFAAANGGTYLEKQGQILFTVPAPINDECWGNEKHCVFRQVGNSVQFNPYYPGNYTKHITSVLNLSPDGVLRGSMSHQNSEFVQVQIDLKE